MKTELRTFQKRSWFTHLAEIMFTEGIQAVLFYILGTNKVSLINTKNVTFGH